MTRTTFGNRTNPPILEVSYFNRNDNINPRIFVQDIRSSIIERMKQSFRLSEPNPISYFISVRLLIDVTNSRGETEERIENFHY